MKKRKGEEEETKADHSGYAGLVSHTGWSNGSVVKSLAARAEMGQFLGPMAADTQFHGF